MFYIIGILPIKGIFGGGFLRLQEGRVKYEIICLYLSSQESHCCHFGANLKYSNSLFIVATAFFLSAAG